MNSMSFEDTVFILNIRIKMIKDTLRLSPPPELFLEKCLDDLVFIDHILAVLAQSLNENGNSANINGEYENFLDAEWQFSQLLLEFSNEASIFSENFLPDTRKKITILRESSSIRRKVIEETSIPTDITYMEPVVSSVELNSLFGGI